MRTIRWKFIHGTFLIVHAMEQPDPTEWRALLKAAEGRTDLPRCLVFANIALPARQRSEIAQLTRSVGTRAVAVMTSLQIVRMVVTGLGWLTGVHRGFAPTELDEALDFLRVGDADRSEILNAAQAFADELGLEELSTWLATRTLAALAPPADRRAEAPRKR